MREVGKLQDDISKIENKINELNYSYEEIERELQGGEDLKKKFAVCMMIKEQEISIKG